MCSVLRGNGLVAVNEAKLTHEFGLVSGVESFGKAVGGLILGADPFNGDVAGGELLLDVAEAQVNVLGASFRCRVTRGDINRGLVVLIYSDRPHVAFVSKLLKQSREIANLLCH